MSMHGTDPRSAGYSAALALHMNINLQSETMPVVLAHLSALYSGWLVYQLAAGYGAPPDPVFAWGEFQSGAGQYMQQFGRKF